ncbi:hypothetical protein BDN72DRAFT_419715 [Pluteus cervinus]|uniref:Uncharacterized protein n=1 Tax=Pluteus cervinus TaxID=181527 RepID=A0ACD3A866_9AGAR|nr:hypothetical protein BDN72DRAFT_419715 [Pluteus cervinus]
MFNTGAVCRQARTPTLPENLEREIFEIAAESSQSCAAKLTQVAKRVNLWITPILCRVITLDRMQTCTYAALFRFKGHHVQEIYSTVRTTILPCIHRFPNIGVLVLYGIYVDADTIKKLTELPVLKELWFKIRCPPDDFTPNFIFLALTHLGLFADSIHLPAFSSNCFPNLTHILIDELPPPNPLILSLLDTCLRLKVLLVTAPVYDETDSGLTEYYWPDIRDRGMYAIERRFSRQDYRIVEFELDLEHEVLGKSLGLLWAKAEGIIDFRRQIDQFNA